MAASAVLGGAIAEWLARQERLRAGLSHSARTMFMHEVGSTEYARKKFGLTADNIAHQVQAKLRSPRPLTAGRRSLAVRIGIDFDNTIVSYDVLFYKVALEQGVIPSNWP